MYRGRLVNVQPLTNDRTRVVLLGTCIARAHGRPEHDGNGRRRRCDGGRRGDFGGADVTETISGRTQRRAQTSFDRQVGLLRSSLFSKRFSEVHSIPCQEFTC